MTDDFAHERNQTLAEERADRLADERRYAPGLVELPPVTPEYQALIDSIFARHCVPVSAILPD